MTSAAANPLTVSSVKTSALAADAAALAMPVSGSWISLAEAAKRAGRTEGHFRRSCPEWATRGLARQVRRDLGRPGWEVREDAHPGFARVKFAEQIGTDLRHLTERQRQTVLLRKQVLDAWEKSIAAAIQLGFDRDAGTGRFLEQLYLGQAIKGVAMQVSRATIYNWHNRYRQGGLVGLADGRAGKSTKPNDADDPFFAEVRRLYLTVRKVKLTTCHEIAVLTAAEKGWEARSYKACQRMVDRIDPRVVKKMRFGEEAYETKAAPYIERDYSGLSSNQIWCGDHHQFDVVVSHGGKLLRPWLTAWQDVRSRKIVGWVIGATDPDTNRILAALRLGMLGSGVPESVLHDNGKDYDAFALHGRTKKDRWERRRLKLPLDEQRAMGVFSALQVEAKFCWPYHGQSKPIERFFGTLENATRTFLTYCGNSPGDRPEDLQLQLERGKAPTLSDFSAWFEGWLEAHHAEEHTGDSMDGRSPDAVWQACLQTKRTTTAELLDVLILPVASAKVGRNGVTYKGLRYGQYQPALRDKIGQDVLLRIDDRDLSRVQVWTQDGRFICMAPSNERVPFAATAEDLRKAIADKKADRRILKEFHERRPRMAEDLPDKLLRAKAAAARDRAIDDGHDPDAPPATVMPVRTAFEDQLPALRSATGVEVDRVAVGAESLSLRDLANAVRNESTAPEESDPFVALRLAMGGGGES
jgi:putative transposase